MMSCSSVAVPPEPVGRLRSPERWDCGSVRSRGPHHIGVGPVCMCAEHVRQLEGGSPFDNLMEVKS